MSKWPVGSYSVLVSPTVSGTRRADGTWLSRFSAEALADLRVVRRGDLHEALLDGRVDFAVHSLKDLETELPPGVALACTLRREDPRDALCARDGMTLAQLPEPGALHGRIMFGHGHRLLEGRHLVCGPCNTHVILVILFATKILFCKVQF